TAALLVLACTLLWTCLAWLAATRLVRADFARVLRAVHETRSEELRRAAGGLGRDLQDMQQAPDWLGGVGQLQELLAHPDNRLLVDAANHWLTELQGKLSIDLVWVMDVSGRVLAASNHQSQGSLIGDRDDFGSYFHEAMAGRNAMQYARGTRTGEPGFYFSSPVHVGGRIVGVAVVKVNVERVAQQLMTPGLFVSDHYGVIVLSDRTLLRGRTLSDAAAVYQLSANERVQRYRQQNFLPMPIKRRDTELFSGLYALEGEAVPVVFMSSHIPGVRGLQAHLMVPVRNSEQLGTRRWVVFGLIEIAGVLLIALLCAVTVFVTRTRTLRRQLLDANAELQRQAETDFLTGAASRRKFEQLLLSEMRRHRRYARTLCLALIDIDHFKLVNDRHGHLAGDEVLRQLVIGIRVRVRGSDLLARMGGEEFALLLPETDPDQALALLERLRTELSQRPVAWNGLQIQFTFSAGLGCWREGENMDEMLDRVDHALYAAKEGGRNRVVMAEPAGHGAPWPVSGAYPA
ncbi:MAG TPA: diguanylate cyclase, partial [Chitinolyticbacter sp.]|nr:diguanylate cyclase [Chitinolyticbacter sp.]